MSDLILAVSQITSFTIINPKYLTYILQKQHNLCNLLVDLILSSAQMDDCQRGSDHKCSRFSAVVEKVFAPVACKH